jgi:serine/threonine protein kinase
MEITVTEEVPVAPPMDGHTAQTKLDTPTPKPSSNRGSSRKPRVGGADPVYGLEGKLVGGRYRIIGPIGEGGMGRVFKVTHAQLGKTYALKIIHHSLAQESESRDLFYREARVASSLAHPNVTNIIDFGEDQAVGAYMVMEYLDGELLSSALKREGRFSLKHSCETVLQIAEALQYIHSNDIIHCDISPENAFICRERGSKRRRERVKLLDFGLARSVRETDSDRISGTPSYLAPEQIQGENITAAADIYALGILFYELLVGHPPWTGNVTGVLAGHLEKKPQTPSDAIGNELDPAVESLILKALEKDPKERQRDMAAFVYELKTVMHMLGFTSRTRPTATRVIEKVVKRPTDRRADLAQLAFDSSRMPMAVLGSDGTIQLANPAFAKFVMGSPVQVEGLAIHSTPLAQVWDSLDADIHRAVRGRSVRRVIQLGDGDNRASSLVMRLDQGPNPGLALFSVHPLTE